MAAMAPPLLQPMQRQQRRKLTRLRRHQQQHMAPRRQQLLGTARRQKREEEEEGATFLTCPLLRLEPRRPFTAGRRSLQSVTFPIQAAEILDACTGCLNQLVICQAPDAQHPV